MENAVAQIDKLRLAIERATSFDEITGLDDKIAAIQAIAKKCGAELPLQNMLAEGRLRAIRKGGEMLAGMDKNKGAATTRLHAATASAPRFSDIGIEKTQSHRWQLIFSEIPQDRFESHIGEYLASDDKELTITSAISLAKQLRKEKQKDKIRTAEHPTCIVSDLQTLIDKGETFTTIAADPPWQYGNQATRASTGNHYETMSIDELCALPVADICDDNAHLHLWTTNGFLFEAKDVMEAWGFEYKSCMVWVKPEMGIGNYWRVSHEFLLFGLRGKLEVWDHGQMSWLKASRHKHSRKPEEAYQKIEALSPGPYLEMFGRMPRNGWTVLGNQIEQDLSTPQAREIKIDAEHHRKTA